MRGKPWDWTDRIEDVFPDNGGFKYITMKKLRDKYMKNAWKDAKTMQEQSGFSLREEDCERSKSIARVAYSTAEASSPPSWIADLRLLGYAEIERTQIPRKFAKLGYSTIPA